MSNYIFIMRNIIAILLMLTFSTSLFADTIVLKDGQKVKGLILNDYKDRIVMSTINGEKTFMKSDLSKAIYDSEIKALLKKAYNLEKKKRHIEAYYVYDKVLEMEPYSESARNRKIYLENLIAKDLKKDFYSELYDRKKDDNAAQVQDLRSILFDKVGFSLQLDDYQAKIQDLNYDKLRGSNVDVEIDDKIVSVWGEMISYMEVDEIAGKLLSPGEVKLTIEREYSVKVPDAPVFSLNPFRSKLSRLVGATILFKKKGLVVAHIQQNGPFYNAGIQNKDIICSVQGKDVNFLPYDEIQKLIMNLRGETADIVVKRRISFWKGERT